MSQVSFSCLKVEKFGVRPDGLATLEMNKHVQQHAAKRGFPGPAFERWTEWNNGDVIYSILVGPDAHEPITYGDYKAVREETRAL